MSKNKVILLGCAVGIIIGGVFAYFQKDHDAYMVVVRERLLFQEPELEVFNIIFNISGKSQNFIGLEGDWSLNQTFSDTRKAFIQDSRLAYFTDYVDFKYLRPEYGDLIKNQQIILRLQRKEEARKGKQVLQNFLSKVKENHREKAFKLFSIYKKEAENYLTLYKRNYKENIEIEEKLEKLNKLNFQKENFIVFDQLIEIRKMDYLIIPKILYIIFGALIFSILSLLLYHKKN